jgi:TolB-like protein
MKTKLLFMLILAASLFTFSNLHSQDRIAVLPFVNLDGKLDLNLWSYNLQDSLTKRLKQDDPQEYNYRVVPIDSIEMALAELNLDPTNPEYKSDMWRAIDALNIDRVVMGEFLFEDERFIINAQVMIVEYRMPDNRHMVRNIFKPKEKIYESIPMIAKKLRQGIIGN